MEPKDLQIAETKKNWETPTVVEISKSEVLGTGGRAVDLSLDLPT